MRKRTAIRTRGSQRQRGAGERGLFLDSGKEIQRLEYNFILPPKFKPALSTSITGESVTLADYPQPGEYEMQITSNLNWVISSNADWLSFGPATGSGNGSVKCSYIKNETGSDLRATVNIKGYYKEVEMASLEYEFILLPVDPFIPELLTPGLPRHMILPLNPQPGDFDFNIVSNLEWEIEHNPLNALWLGFSEDSGSGNATVKCMFSKNEAGRNLETTVYFIGYQSLPGGERRERVRLDYKFTLPTFVGKLDTDL